MPYELQRLNAREHMPPPLGPRAADVQLAERARRPAPPGRCAATAPGSRFDGRRRAAMAGRSPRARKIGGSPGPQRRSCRCLSPRPPDCDVARGRSFGRDGFEHLLLVGIRPHLQPCQRDRHPVVLRASRRLGERVVQPVSIAIRVVALEGRVVPVGVERGPELLEKCRSRRPETVGRSTPLHRAARRVTGSTSRRTPCRSRCLDGTSMPWRAAGCAGRRTAPSPSAPKSRTSRSSAARSVAPM